MFLTASMESSAHGVAYESDYVASPSAFVGVYFDFNIDSTYSFMFSSEGSASRVTQGSPTITYDSALVSYSLRNRDTGDYIFDNVLNDGVDSYLINSILEEGTYQFNTYVLAGFSVSDGEISGLAQQDFELSLTAVPIPAAVWLFGSGLISLVGFARRKKA